MNRFDPLRKLMHVDEAVARFAALTGTVFTHGAFDVLNRGDVAERPLHREGDRAFQVAALESVDAVIIFNEPSAVALLARLRPAVYVERGDHDMGRLAETALMHSWGGHAIALPFADGFPPASALADRFRDAVQPVTGER